MRELRVLGCRLQHLFGAAEILIDSEFCQAFWNMFPNLMQDWLTNDQNINPFNPTAPLDAEKFANHFQRYWQN